MTFDSERAPVSSPLQSPAGARMPGELIDTVLASLEDSKAEDIVSLDISKKSSLADYMVIVSGRSQHHVGAIADHLLRDLKDAGSGNANVEGQAICDWVLIDAGDVVVHIFRPEVRGFYNLEKMWAAEEETTPHLVT